MNGRYYIKKMRAASTPFRPIPLCYTLPPEERKRKRVQSGEREGEGENSQCIGACDFDLNMSLEMGPICIL